jgi:hypothetical protein
MRRLKEEEHDEMGSEDMEDDDVYYQELTVLLY